MRKRNRIILNAYKADSIDISYKKAGGGFVHDVNGTCFYSSSPSQGTPLVCKIIPVTWFLPYFNLAGKAVIHGFSFGVEKKSHGGTCCK